MSTVCTSNGHVSLLRKYGTCTTVKARFLPWLSGESPWNHFSCSVSLKSGRLAVPEPGRKIVFDPKIDGFVPCKSSCGVLVSRRPDLTQIDLEREPWLCCQPRDQSAVFRSLDLCGSSPDSGGLWYRFGGLKKTMRSHSEGLWWRWEEEEEARSLLARQLFPPTPYS